MKVNQLKTNICQVKDYHLIVINGDLKMMMSFKQRLELLFGKFVKCDGLHFLIKEGILKRAKTKGGKNGNS